MCDNLDFQKATVVQKRVTGSQFEYLVQDPGQFFKIVYPGWYRSVAILDKDHSYTQDELQEIIENLCQDIGDENEWIEIITEIEGEYA